MRENSTFLLSGHIPHSSSQGLLFFFFLTGFPKSFCQMPTTNNPSLGVNSCNCANDCSHKRQPAIDVCVSSLHSPAFCFHQIKVYSKIRHYIALSLPMGNVTNLAMYIYIYIHTHICIAGIFYQKYV